MVCFATPIYLGSCARNVGAASPQQHSSLQPITPLPLFSNRVLILKAQMCSQGAKMIAEIYFNRTAQRGDDFVSSYGQVGLIFIR